MEYGCFLAGISKTTLGHSNDRFTCDTERRDRNLEASAKRQGALSIEHFKR
jgi:hypothetical protein